MENELLYGKGNFSSILAQSQMKNSAETAWPRTQKFLGLRQAFLPQENSSRTRLLLGERRLDSKRHEEVRGLFKRPS